jgi:hypothetical protein
VKNEVFRGVKVDMSIIHKRRLTGLATSSVGTAS